MSSTRVFRRPPEWARPGKNEATMVLPGSMLRPDSIGGGKVDAEALFVERWSMLKKGLEAHPKQGVLVMAFDARSTAVGQAWLAATLDRTRVAILGRHSMCHLPLPPEHEEISLRHAAILVRARSHDEVRIRVIDLHTKTGFHDESGRVLQAVATEGSMFLRFGPVTLVFLVTGDETPLPEDPRDAYRCIPPRVFVDERLGTAGEPDPRQSIMPLARGMPGHIPGTTYVRSQVGAVAAAGSLCKDDEPPVASLVVRSGGGAVRRAVGPSILQRGLLVGRYARCEVGTSSDEDSRLSRVHLLLVEDGDDTMAIDTGSTNGTTVAEKTISAIALEDGMTLHLADELDLEWHVVS